MAEYERSRWTNAPEDAVLRFVPDVRNLPAYLPTVQSAEPMAEDRIRLRGNSDGAAVEDVGWLHIDRDRRRLEWSDPERDYSGWMQISGDDGGTQVVAHLSLPPHVGAGGRPLTGERRGTPDPVEQGLEAAMDSLRQVIEGTGGGIQPSVTS